MNSRLYLGTLSIHYRITGVMLTNLTLCWPSRSLVSLTLALAYLPKKTKNFNVVSGGNCMVFNKDYWVFTRRKEVS